MGTQTALHALPYPVPNDPADVPADMQRLANKLDTDGLFADNVVAAAARLVANKLLAADAQPAFRILGNGKLDWGPGGSGVPDVSLYRNGIGQLRADAMLLVVRPTAADVAVYIGPPGESQARFTVQASGALNWGGGTSLDTTLSRIGPATLKAADTFCVGGQVYTGHSGGNGAIFMGVAQDAYIFRNAPGEVGISTAAGDRGIQVGLPDSAGAGFRALRVAN